MDQPIIVHITRDHRGQTLTLAQPGGLTVNVTQFEASQDAELRTALRFAHTITMLPPSTMLRLKRQESAH
jgi:hypothetical protein